MVRIPVRTEHGTFFHSAVQQETELGPVGEKFVSIYGRNGEFAGDCAVYDSLPVADQVEVWLMMRDYLVDWFA